MNEHHQAIADKVDEYRKFHPIVENYENEILVSVTRGNLHADGDCNCRMTHG